MSKINKAVILGFIVTDFSPGGIGASTFFHSSIIVFFVWENETEVLNEAITIIKTLIIANLNIILFGMNLIV